jgi:hypothetical protein
MAAGFVGVGLRVTLPQFPFSRRACGIAWSLGTVLRRRTVEDDNGEACPPTGNAHLRLKNTVEGYPAPRRFIECPFTLCCAAHHAKFLVAS